VFSLRERNKDGSITACEQQTNANTVLVCKQNATLGFDDATKCQGNHLVSVMLLRL
jgi:hypothetical protein